MTWAPHVTVAAIVQQDERFLFVREHADNKIVINQPAGHLEPGETVLHAVVRETLEETAWKFTPDALVAIYRWVSPNNDQTYLRFAFSGSVTEHDPERILDQGIIESVWLSRSELETHKSSLRSPLVVQCVKDYLSGKRYDLALLSEIN